MKLWKKGVMVFFMVWIFLSSLTGLYQLFMWDLQVDNLVANLNGEKSRCTNVLQKNNNNLPDIINNERTSADKLSFSISPRCYKLINSFKITKDLEIRYFFLGKIRSYFWLMALSVIIACGYLILNVKKEIDNNYKGDENENENENLYY